MFNVVYFMFATFPLDTFLVIVSSSSVKCLSTSVVGLEIGSKSFVCKLFFQWFLHSKLNIYTYSCLCLCVDNT